ncbi:MAG: HAD-IIA family hydrolase [bacterium]|nr:HAD-IIA family hydrolase [bacterium]
MRIKGLLLDVEGVLVADKRYQAVLGAVEFIARLRAQQIPFRLITNNTTDPRPALVEKLNRAGYDFTAAEVHTCTAAAVTHLQTHGARSCLVLGGESLRGIFVEAGFSVLESSEVDAVVVGLDTQLTFDRLRIACDAVSRRGAAFLALHRNRVYTDADGCNAPSVGAIAEAIRYATQTDPVVIGKPSPTYFQQALDEIDTAPEEVMVVSDDPFSDLAGAKRMGMKAAFVLSGKYPDTNGLEDIPPAERPDLVAPRIGDLLSCGNITLG